MVYGLAVLRAGQSPLRTRRLPKSDRRVFPQDFSSSTLFLILPLAVRLPRTQSRGHSPVPSGVEGPLSFVGGPLSSYQRSVVFPRKTLSIPFLFISLLDYFLHNEAGYTPLRRFPATSVASSNPFNSFTSFSLRTLSRDGLFATSYFLITSALFLSPRGCTPIQIFTPRRRTHEQLRAPLRTLCRSAADVLRFACAKWPARRHASPSAARVFYLSFSTGSSRCGSIFAESLGQGQRPVSPLRKRI